MTSPLGGTTVQERLYFLLGELQKLAKDIPLRFQQRLTMDMLSGLANALVDGTLFEITRQLFEIQQVTEKQAFQARQQLLADQNNARQSLLRRHKSELLDLKASSTTATTLSAATSRLESVHVQQTQELAEKHLQELTRYDMKVVMQLDQKVSEQQVILEKSGLPGFHVTNDSMEIKLQQHTLALVSEISQLNLPPVQTSTPTDIASQ